MKRHAMRQSGVRFSLAALLVAFAVHPASAGGEIPLSEAEVFVELNDTDGDLGIHSNVDGDAWRALQILSPNERPLVRIRNLRGARLQGLTQLMFESAEPTFDELPPEEFFARFPEGIYDIEAITIDGEEMEGEALFSHVLAAPPVISANGFPVSEDCDADPGPVVSDPVLISWVPVTGSHPEIGRPGDIDVALYEFVLESDDAKLTVQLPSHITEFAIPSAYLALTDEWKVEVLVRTQTHNNTSTESCFVVE